MNDWYDHRWGDLATLEYGKGIRDYADASGEFPVYGTNGQIGWHDEALWHAPGVVIGRKGAYRGVHYSGRPFFVIDTAFYLKPKVDFDMRWAYYQLLTQDINGLDSGSAIPSTSRDDFYRLAVLVPPLSTQRRIAEILGRLDDKIEVNRRINRTLERMAQALYRHWFVDFAPFRDGEFVESEVGLAPRGWEVITLDELVEIEANVINPQSHPEEVFDHYSIPAYDEQRLPVAESGAAVKSGKYLIQSKRVLVSKLNPATPRVWTVFDAKDRRSFTSTEFIHYICRSPSTWSFVNGYLRSQAFLDEFRAHVAGTTGSRQRVPPRVTMSFKLVKPPADVLRAFDELVGPYLVLIQRNLEEGQVLAAIRDYLLPRLLAGEVEV